MFEISFEVLAAAYWAASKRAHTGLYSGVPDQEAMDALVDLGDCARWPLLRSRCNQILNKYSAPAQVAATVG